MDDTDSDPLVIEDIEIQVFELTSQQTTLKQNHII